MSRRRHRPGRTFATGADLTCDYCREAIQRNTLYIRDRYGEPHHPACLRLAKKERVEVDSNSP